MEIIDCIQGTPEWFEARRGVPTSSNFDKIVTTLGKPSKQQEKYMYKLAGEAVSGVMEETYQNATMLRGIEMEEEARKLYQIAKGKPVVEVGFCLSKGYGASPDGLVGDNGCLEIKCPLVATHVGYLLKNELPAEYFHQVQGQLLVTGREWVDFLSYYPGLRPLIIRVERDQKFLDILEEQLKIFCVELDKTINQVRS